MRFLLLLALWATLAFVPSWLVAQAWQHAIAAVASRLASPAGAVIEIVDLQLYYPFDLGIYLALCLASTWVRWGRRWRAVAAGLPVLILVEIGSLAVALAAMMRGAAGSAQAAEEAQRFAVGVIRVTGLVAAAGAWFYLLGRERLPLAARTR